MFDRRQKMYLAAGWFNPVQDAELTRLEQIMESREDWIDMASPRRIFICPPNASREVQDATYQGNLKHIREADFLVVNTRDKDLGTIMECGYATAFDKHIIYFCAGLPAGAKFNLMLSRSGAKVCTSFEDLEDYLNRCKAAGAMIYEPYDKEIE
jgi:nucleoside 2-deoxyribosyltransferase